MAATHKEMDISMMLAAKVHLGTKNCDFQMERYISRRQNTGIYVINLGKTWEKMVLAARVIAAIENPQDVCVLSARTYGQRAVLKFCEHTGCKALAGRHTPGTFTNQIQKMFEEPRLLILTDPRCVNGLLCCCTPKLDALSSRWTTVCGMTESRLCLNVQYQCLFRI
jgi:small subunit ribosomal protein SAe